MRKFFKGINILYVSLSLIATITNLVIGIFFPSVGNLRLPGFNFSFISYPVSLLAVFFSFSPKAPLPIKLAVPILALLILASFLLIALKRLTKKNKFGMLLFIYLTDILLAFILVGKIANASTILSTLMIRLLIIVMHFISRRKAK